MTTRWARFARGWIAAAVSVFVALCSHVLAGGALPSAAGIALCLAFAGIACIALAGKRLSLTRLSISVALSQFLFHGVFSVLGTTSVPVPRAASMAAMNMSQAPLQISPVADTGMAMPAWMWAAHGVAAIITVIALRFGERSFWRLVELARPLLRLLVGFLAPTPLLREAPPSPSASRWVPKNRALFLSTMRHRGPPAMALL